MPIGEIILGTIGEVIGYVVIELLFKGIGRLFRYIYYGIRKVITGKERDISELKRIENRILFKKFKLKSNFNIQIQKSTRGTVMEVIDKQNLLVEFEDQNGKVIINNGKQTFKIKLRNIILEKTKG